MSKNYIKAKSKEIMGTSGKGRILTTFKKLLATFGEPTLVDTFDNKVRVQWAFKVPCDGPGFMIITIYDYKAHEPVEKIIDWHIGGKGEAQEIVRWVCKELGITSGTDAYVFEQPESVSNFLRYVGMKGGQATKKKYGPEYYKKLRKLGREGYERWRKQYKK